MHPRLGASEIVGDDCIDIEAGRRGFDGGTRGGFTFRVWRCASLVGYTIHR